MKWPWVSRATLEAKLREVDAEWMKLVENQRATANGFVERAQEHARQAIQFIKDRDMQYEALLAKYDSRVPRDGYDALLEKYHSLRAAGAVVPTPSARVPYVVRKAADEAVEEVMARFPGASELRRRLQRYVQTERAKPDADELAIAEKVTHWSDPEDESAVA